MTGIERHEQEEAQRENRIKRRRLAALQTEIYGNPSYKEMKNLERELYPSRIQPEQNMGMSNQGMAGFPWDAISWLVGGGKLA